jgi:hypothetical protein
MRMGEWIQSSTVETAYNDIGLSDASNITSNIMPYQLIPNNIIFLCYNDTRL